MREGAEEGKDEYRTTRADILQVNLKVAFAVAVIDRITYTP